jgi:hypothetical protein
VGRHSGVTVSPRTSVEGELSPDLLETVEALNGLADEELWRSARAAMSPEASRELEALHLKQRDEELSQAEEATRVKLIHEYERTLLTRAQAVKLLRDRGHDISGLLANR